MGNEDDSDSGDPFLAAIAHIESEAQPAVRRPGARVGRFTIRAELGRGGMGVVYRADDEQLGRSVALKMLRAGPASDEGRRARFVREARSAASLVHPNVAALYDIGEADGELFIAMELVEGEDLRRVLSRGPLPVTEAVRIGRGIARGVSAAHQRGIVHRDLKPENVMLDGDGEPKVLDFGLAKLTEGDAHQALTEEGLLLGTPGYMSPEQASGDPVDARSDVFSFGVLLFEMLTGRRPFVGESRTDVLTALVRDAAPQLTTLRAGLPRTLEQLVSTCLEKTPSARPATMRAVLEALTEVTSIAAPPRRSRGRRFVTAGVAIAIVMVLAVGSVKLRGREVRTVARARPVTDYPPPATRSAEAAAAYASAMQDLRDASLSLEVSDLARAVTLDPSFAAAHLRYLVPWQVGTLLVGAREHYAAAWQSRQSLDPRERLLLAAGEAVIQSPVDWLEVATRLRAVLAAFPDDVEALTSLAWVDIAASDPVGARAAARQALVVDPQFATAHWLLASSYFFESADEAQREVARCLALSPSAATCLRQQEDLYRWQGKCAESEAVTRKMVAVEPRGMMAYWSLADALAVRGAPLESTRAAVDRLQVLFDDPDFPIANLLMSLLVGDFPATIAGAQQVDRVLASETSEGGHVPAAMIQIASLEEEGRLDDAFAVAESFEHRSPAWVADDWRVRHYLLYARHHRGLLGDAELARDLATIEAEALAQRTRRSAPSVELVLRTSYFEPSDLPAALPYLEKPSFLPEVEALRGHALLVVGRAADAVAPLRTAAAECGILARDDNHNEDELLWGGSQTFTFMRSHLWLGEALEATGDTAGACTAYRVVLDRWKNAKPRSLTLESARTRARALHCE